MRSSAELVAAIWKCKEPGHVTHELVRVATDHLNSDVLVKCSCGKLGEVFSWEFALAAAKECFDEAGRKHNK